MISGILASPGIAFGKALLLQEDSEGDRTAHSGRLCHSEARGWLRTGFE